MANWMAPVDLEIEDAGTTALELSDAGAVGVELEDCVGSTYYLKPGQTRKPMVVYPRDIGGYVDLSDAQAATISVRSARSLTAGDIIHNGAMTIAEPDADPRGLGRWGLAYPFGENVAPGEYEFDCLVTFGDGTTLPVPIPGNAKLVVTARA